MTPVCRLAALGLAQEELGALDYTERHRYMPLPQDKVDTNPQLEQLAGW